MNVASNRILIGDTIGALKDYGWMQREIEHGVSPVSPLLLPLIDYNKWVVTNDTTALLRLKLQTRDNELLKGYDAMAAAYLAEIEIKQGISDSLTMRLHDMEAGVDFTDDLTQKAFILKMLGRTYDKLGDHAKAYRYLNSYPDIVEDNLEFLSNDKYTIAETEREINQIEQQQKHEKTRALIKVWTIVIVLIIIVAMSGWFVFRRLKRLYREKDSDRKEIERGRRSELAMSLAVHEKQQQIEQLHRQIYSLVDDELINHDAANKLESSIRSEQGASKADEEFGRLFISISPDFHRRLREKCPRIGRNTLRMAEYIAIGMDTRHIARVMNIRHSSVRQNRWRLRKALGLDSDDSLDKYLREML